LGASAAASAASSAFSASSLGLSRGGLGRRGRRVSRPPRRPSSAAAAAASGLLVGALLLIDGLGRDCLAALVTAADFVGARLDVVLVVFRLGHRTLPLRVMPAVRARGSELAELVPDHRLRDEHGNVLAPVVDGDRMTHELREDRRRARPGTDHRPLVGVVHLLDAREETILDPRPLL
jgi:hypothetical protein